MDGKQSNSEMDAGYVNIYIEEEAERWSKHLGITKEELHDAVMAAGKSTIAIKKFLERMKLAKVEREND